MEERFRFDPPRCVRVQNPRHQFQERLNRSLGPAMLLRFERIHLDRQLRRRDMIVHEDELPATQLGAIAQVEILGERIVLPAAAVGDRGAPPDAGGAVEIEEAPAAITAAVLEHEVRVEQNRLNLGQQ
jgi:hypothetical protein